MVIKRQTIRNIAMFLIVSFTVLLSKTVYFGVVNRSIYQYVFWVVALAAALVAKLRWKKVCTSFFMVFPMLLMLGMNLMFHIDDMGSDRVNQVIGIMVTISVCAMIAGTVPGDYFSACYIRIMVLMCVISLPCWLLAVSMPETALGLCQPGFDWRVQLGYSPFYTWGWYGTIFRRNSGMFWEPGAFQGFIFLAVLMILFETDGSLVKNRKSTLIILIVTMLTTQSTTGYILLIALILISLKRIEKVFGNINKNIRMLIVLVLCCLTLYYVLSSGNIAAKFGSAGSQSADIRFGDIAGGVLLCLKGGVLGLGETVARDSYKALLGVNVNDSAGWLSMIYTYGILFGGYYIWMMVRAVKGFFNTDQIHEHIVLGLFFAVLNLTEGLWNLPVYLCILFIGVWGGY